MTTVTFETEVPAKYRQKMLGMQAWLRDNSPNYHVYYVQVDNGRWAPFNSFKRASRYATSASGFLVTANEIQDIIV